MKKVVDSTFVSALAKEIPSIDLFPIICRRYEVIISKEVRKECENHFHSRIDEFKSLSKIDLSNNSKYEDACQYLVRRYSWLGLGEISTIVSSILLTSVEIDNYLVTDDHAARNLIDTIHTDSGLESILDIKIKKD